MKTSLVGVLVLILVGGYLNADEPPTNSDSGIVLNLDTASEVLVNAFIAPIEFATHFWLKRWQENTPNCKGIIQ